MSSAHRSVVLVGAVAALLSAGVARGAIIVEPGFDLFESGAGTTFLGLPFTGVPLGTFDFGGLIGVKNTGTTDTIVQRLTPASVPLAPALDTIDIEMVALQLVSIAPVDVGAGFDFHYITLQVNRGVGDPPPGPPTLGMMDITFDDPAGGSFGSFLDVFFDFRIGAVDGPILNLPGNPFLIPDFLTLTSTAVPWDRTPRPFALEIEGVNSLLNGVDTSGDFWASAFVETHPSGAMHSVQSAVPAPGSIALLALGGLLARRRRR